MIYYLSLTYLQVEYRPCETPNGCTALINEFLASHFGDLKEGHRLIATPAEYPDIPAPYSHRHAAHQYLRLFTEMGLLENRR